MIIGIGRYGKSHIVRTLSVRNGTDVDQDNLLMTLQQLDFEVKVYKDLPYKEIENILERLSRDNHSDADCIFVAFLSWSSGTFACL